MKQRKRVESAFKNQLNDSKDQEVVMCVAQISTPCFLPHRRFSHTTESPSSCHSFISSHLPSSHLLPLEHKQPLWFNNTVAGAEDCFVSFSLSFHRKAGKQEPVQCLLELMEYDEGRALASLRGEGLTTWIKNLSTSQCFLIPYPDLVLPIQHLRSIIIKRKVMYSAHCSRMNRMKARCES